MKKLNVNDWMRWDMGCDPYFAVYAESKDEWWILARCDSINEAAEAAKRESVEGGSGEYFVIDQNGKRVKG